jgi:hypothetical protein
VLLSQRVASIRGEVKGLPAQAPCCHNAFALEEVIRHVGSVALVAHHRVHMLGEGLVRAGIVALVQHHVVDKPEKGSKVYFTLLYLLKVNSDFGQLYKILALRFVSVINL